MSCTIIKADPDNAGATAKIKDMSKHGDLVKTKSGGLCVVYKIDNICDLLRCDNGKYFPRVCNVVPNIVTKHITNPYDYYKKYFRYIQEINIDPIVHRDIILNYVEPNLEYEYTFDKESFYAINKNGYADSYNIKTRKLEQSNIPPFMGY
jgi:hypothetical protein